MRKSILVFTFIFIFLGGGIIKEIDVAGNDSTPVRGKFFISSLRGNDGNSGTSENSPWMTLGKLTSEIYNGNVSPTDSIFLERGSRFKPENLGHTKGNGQRGIINFPDDWHGESDEWFYIGPYGEGDKPLISDEMIAEYSSVIHSQGSIKYIHLNELHIEGLIRFDIYSQEKSKGGTHIKLTGLYLDGQNRDKSFYMRPAFEHRHPFEYHRLTAVRKIHIENCVFVNQGGEDVLNFSGPIDSIYIGYNKIIGASEECLDISGGRGHLVEYNLFEGSGDKGQTIKIHSQHRRNENGILRGNIITASSSVKFAAAFNNIRNWEIKDNIFFNPDGWSIGLSASGSGSNPPQMYYWDENNIFDHTKDFDSNLFEGNTIIGKANVQWWQNTELVFPNGIKSIVNQENLLLNNIIKNNILHPGNSDRLMRVQYFEGNVEWTSPDGGIRWQCGDPPDRTHTYYTIGEINSYPDNSGNTSELSSAIDNFTESNRLWFTLNLDEGWNLLSLPAEPSRAFVNELFPGISAGSFYYYRDGKYFRADSLRTGVGYWFYSPVKTDIFFPGIPIESLNFRLSEGWNLIGNISYDLNIDSVSDPGNIIHQGSWLVFNDSRYIGIDSLRKGKAYWVYADGEGVIHIGD